MQQKYTIEQVGGFFEVYNHDEQQTEFASENKLSAVHALKNLRKSGKISHRLLQPKN